MDKRRRPWIKRKFGILRKLCKPKPKAADDLRDVADELYRLLKKYEDSKSE